jgi:tetratricopeptide (TPR) repeat protein
MKKTSSWVVFLAWGLTGLFFSGMVQSTLAAAPCEPVVARVVSVQGNVEVRRAGQAQSQPARLNDSYCAGDRIQVGERSRADLALVNQPLLRLDQKTVITLAEPTADRVSLINLTQGALHFFSRLPRNLQINTAFVNAGVEGTEGLVEVEADRALVTIFEGRALAANAAGSLTLTDGQSAVAEKGQALLLRTIVRPRDAVQWALYYPPVTYFRPEELQGPEPWRPTVRQSYEAYSRGDYQAAFDGLKGVPDNVTDPRFFAYRASLLLGVGRVDEAEPDLDRALKLNPGYADALALQAIVAVVQNDKERAVDLARKAVSADPKSASALTALSYAQQANFDLEGARASLLRAVETDPNNALAWARLAELHMSFGELDAALEAAEKAVALDPNLPRTQMVLGFAYLLRVDTAAAKAAFEKAIALDQADSLSRLGLGLTKIRESNFEEGRRDIEIAASLDPNNSIVRSYLGKAYYEEKRTEAAERDYAVAKQLDPQDPTPYFYDAILKQTTNRPVEALQDMEKAIDLNDNRAVYRSRLELDADLAARSASLARIYSDLGFQQLALVEGWKSVNTDPANFSAHRFLADSYSILPRHEIARVSELLQSQLLQPLNMTPIQPQLAESNLLLLSAAGPGSLSFNEFNPIFNRNGVTFQTSAMAGENDTYGGEAVLAAIYKKLSFSLGGFRFQTDGWRKNADQKDNIGNAFMQVELSPSTSLQAEYRYRNIEFGDLQLRFFRENFFRGQRNNEERNFFRVGARHDLSPSSILLASFSFQHADSRLRDKQFPVFPFTSVDFRLLNERGFGTEVQHLFRSRLLNLTTGIGYFHIDGILRSTLGTVLPPPDDILPQPPQDNSPRHLNVYSYAYIALLKSLTVTFGASVDRIIGQFPGDDISGQFNPKFGVTWNPLADTTIRAAAFRAVKRTLITNATLEPTQVAGFNQFFDDINLSESWRYGIAIDQKFAKTIFGGVEFSKRDLDVPFVQFGAGAPSNQEADWNENLARAYLFWTPHPWWAVRADYIYERLKRDEDFLLGAKEARTHRVPLGVNFYHPSGLGSFLTATYIHQQGKFEQVTGFPPRSGREDFWTLDAGVRYRIPKRYGFVTVGATNLLNNRFNYFDSDIANPIIQPKRTGFLRVTLALP